MTTEPDSQANCEVLKSAIADLSLAIMQLSSAMLISARAAQAIHADDLATTQEAIKGLRSLSEQTFKKAESAFKKVYPDVE